MVFFMCARVKDQGSYRNGIRAGVSNLFSLTQENLSNNLKRTEKNPDQFTIY